MKLPSLLFSDSAVFKVMPEILRLSAPLAIAQITSISIMTADFWMMGQLGAYELAAGSLGVRLYQPFYFLSLGMLSIISALVAQAIGSGRPENARRIYRQGLVLAIALSVIFMPPIIYGPDILVLLGQAPDIATSAGPFLIYTAAGFPFMLLFLTMRFFTIGHRRAGPQLAASLFALCVNLLLNPVFSYGLFGVPEMGLAGIALATTASYLAASLLLGLQIGLLPPFAASRPYHNLWRLDLAMMRQMIRIGLPSSFLVASETGMFVAAAFIIGLFGAAALAAAAITNQIAAIAFMIPLSLSQACAILVGQAAGEKNQQRVSQYGWAGGVLGAFMALPLTVLLAVFPEFLASLFLKTDDRLAFQTLQLVVPMLWIAALFQLSDAMQIIFTANLRGLNDTFAPALYGFWCFWCVGLGGGFIMAHYLSWGPVSVWGGLALGLSLNAIMLIARWHRRLTAVRQGRRALLQASVR